MPVSKATAAIELPPLNIQTIQLMLVGDSPLIVHAWSEKAKRQMLDKQMKKATKAKEAKDPQAFLRDGLEVAGQRIDDSENMAAGEKAAAIGTIRRVL